MAYSQPEPLSKGHIRDDFDCGKAALNEWLQKHAAISHASDSARVYVTTDDGELVVGYFALAGAQAEPENATERLAKGQSQRPIPVVLLA